MKRLYAVLLAIVFALSFSTISHAQIIGYTYKPFAPEGCQMQYNIALQGDQCYIIATISSDRMQFLGEPTMLIRTSDGEVLKLDGVLLDSRSESAGLVCGYMVIPVTSVHSSAQFSITPEQLEKLKSGVKKIRLSTTPYEHEREFRKDKIGARLYKTYLNMRDRHDNF